MALISEEPSKGCLKSLPPNFLASGEFLIVSAKSLSWGDLSNDVIMDVGCGPDSYILFKTLFPNFKKVIGLDVSQSYINYAKFFRKSPRMDYHVADITNRSSLATWEGQMSKVVSLYSFNCLLDQKTGFENIHYLLKPGGEAVIITALKNPHYECAKYLFENPRWKLYQHLERQFTDHQAHGTGINFYEKILKDIDFDVILCSEDSKCVSFSTEEELRASALTKDKIVKMHLPPSVQEEFKEEYVQALMTLNGRSPNGELCIRTSSAKIVIRKKL